MSKKVIDLFAGVGGLSLGAARAGFDLAAAVELDQRAIESHARNFPGVAHLQEDIASLAGSRLLELAAVAQGDLFGLIGGPPCQGFSEIGLKADEDPRNELFAHFFRLVSETRPAFFLAENVPGILSPRNGILRERALSQIPQSYTLLTPIKATASDFGVPTSRTRIFFIGFDRNRIGELSNSDFTPQDMQDTRVRDALLGIPAIRANWQLAEQGWRSVGSLPKSDYSDRLSEHIPSGIGDPEALNAYKTKRLVSGLLGTHHTAETINRFRKLKPGERDVVSKSMRLSFSGYCPTLRAGTGPERGSFQAVRPVHPSSPRVISPREAARLQGFPDWFQFHQTKWHSFRQIGNSVSPIVAERLLNAIFKAAN